MSQERADLILEPVRAIRGDIAGIKTAPVEIEQWLGLLEAHDVGPIKRRLDLVAG